MQDKITIADAPDCLNTNDKAMWVLGYQAALEARSTCLHQIQEPAAAEQAAWHAGLDEGRAQAGASQRAMVRYCPECSHIGEVGAGHRDCCPDGSQAFMVPEKHAEGLRTGFLVRITQTAPAAVAVPDECAAFEAKFRHLDLSQKPDAWGHARYSHDAISLAWKSWQARAALAATPAHHAPDAKRLIDEAKAHASKASRLTRVLLNEPTGTLADTDIAIWIEHAQQLLNTLAATPAAAPVVLPEPDAVISEVMGLVDEWGMESHLRGAAELDAQHSEATQEEIDCAKDRASKERAAWKAIESKLRALLAAGGEAQAAPAFYAALGSNGCALPQYSAGTEEGVILNVLSVARNEGYTGSGLDRLIELGWVVRPVYTRPTPATADSLATATGLPAQAVPLKLIEAINTACGGNEWQGEALAPYLLEAACRAITSLAPQAQAVPDFCHVASLKLKSLHERGYQITGYALEKPVEGAQPERGFINHSGFVGWWWDGQSPQAQADARDAERYRYLRGEHEGEAESLCVFGPDDMRECLVPIGSLPGELDAFIDAAIAAAKGE